VYGPLFRKALSPSVVAAARPATSEAAERELRRLAVDSPRAPGESLERIAFDGLARALFGFEPGSREHDAFRSAYGALAEQDLGAPLTPETRAALGALRRLVADLDGEAPGSALRELRQLDPELPDAICVDNLILTLKFASANVVSLLHWLLAMLGRHPEWAERMRHDPTLVDKFIMETLRLAQSEYLYRVVTRDFEFEGFRFPRGWLIRLCVWESHRTSDAFDEPETFDPDRFVENSYRTSDYSPFGWGQHACNGVPLTYMICGAVLSTLVAGYAWEVTGDGPAERDFRHWHHWRPSSTLRLGVAPRSAQTRPRSANTLATNRRVSG
jgi:cytochrome P450